MSCMPTTLSFAMSAALPVASSPPGSPVGLRRPGLLIRAARAGLPGWRRGRDLPRLLGSAVLPPPAQVMRALMAEEERMDEARRARAADYSVERHVSLLIAMLSELRASPPASAAILPFVAPVSGRGTARPARP